MENPGSTTVNDPIADRKLAMSYFINLIYQVSFYKMKYKCFLLTVHYLYFDKLITFLQVCVGTL